MKYDSLTSFYARK